MSTKPLTHAEREALVMKLAQMPAELRERPQWLLWRYVAKPGASKPAKVPYYVSGELRGWPRGKPKDGQPTEAQPQVAQGAELDRAELVTCEAAVAALRAKPGMHGVGFAFLPGDGLLGVDIDHAIDPETGEISELCTTVLGLCPSYAETSVSGTGVHIILSGHTAKFKDDAIGLEVYCDSQYFTCTGAQWPGSPSEVRPVAPLALQIMQGLVDASKARQAADKVAAKAQAAPPPPPPAPTAPSRTAAPFPGGQKGADFQRVNTAALHALSAWVPELFPQAVVHGTGYRVSSKALGRDLQEDIGIKPEGIRDFGEECGKSPIDLVVQWRGLPLAEALRWLAARVGVALEPPRRAGAPALAPAASRRPEPPPEGELQEHDPDDDSFMPDEDSLDDGDRPEPPLDGAESSTPGAGGKLRRQGGRGGRQRKLPPEFFERLDVLRAHFALIYGTDTVWDGQHRCIMKIANMGHAHGSELLKWWKGGTPVWRRSEVEPGCRWTVRQEDVVFDPTGAADPDAQVNLFGGFPTQPLAGDVGPMLELLNFLVSRAGHTPEERDGILHWLLCWLAYPLQHPGAKLRTSVLMYGDEGAGKNFLTDLMVEIYGPYGVTVGQDELEDKFNDWRSCKLFVVGDEVSTRTELAHNKNRLKAVITGTTAQINPKNLPRRTEANHANVWFNSNENQALALDNSDRRYLVVWTPKAREFEFYQRLGKWRADGGAAKWLDYLLRYEINDFDVFKPAPLTKAKEALIDVNRRPPERFWLEWSGGELSLPYASCTVDQAYQAYQSWGRRSGDRFPATKATFSSLLQRVSDSMGVPIEVKVMKAAFGFREKDVRTARMLLVQPIPDPLPEGTTQQDWATNAVRLFEEDLQSYRGRFGAKDEGGTGGDGDA